MKLAKYGGGGGWAKGVGYGSGGYASGWNPDAYVKAQREKERQVNSSMYRTDTVT